MKIIDGKAWTLLVCETQSWFNKIDILINELENVLTKLWSLV